MSQLLGGLTPGQFLKEYWQQKPLLVRQAVADFPCPVAPGELAGLACDEEVESRLLLEKGGERPWQLEHGPFSEERFPNLPESHWTLLVQEINKHVPEFALLQDRFNFLPNWRLDDVMVSFAPPGGTVGPHADNYDVFLIQGPGRRRWQISSRTPAEEDLIPDLDVRILRDFQPEQEWVLEPGDMLYLPPGIAHHGVALEDCITISVGFRAPAEAELIAAFAAQFLDTLDPERFYRDAGRVPARVPGEIDQPSRKQIHAIIRQMAMDDGALDRWFGRFTTAVRPGHWLPESEAAVDFDALFQRMNAGEALWRSEYARFAHFSDEDGTVHLFVAGEEYPLPEALTSAAVLLAGQRRFTAADFVPIAGEEAFRRLVTELYARGCLFFPE
ncbi:cupin domain-containing protein [Thiohalomonas denitrificans]|uniref:cupin domain-containing protein n=1 Tax=Thiohalomonas denitrificans TaxID=415747 RepID=UPI0026F36ADE|nr:cupin domain-containing protein [Thiohalomonas denitrificans]